MQKSSSQLFIHGHLMMFVFEIILSAFIENILPTRTEHQNCYLEGSLQHVINIAPDHESDIQYSSNLYLMNIVCHHLFTSTSPIGTHNLARTPLTSLGPVGLLPDWSSQWLDIPNPRRKEKFLDQKWFVWSWCVSVAGSWLVFLLAEVVMDLNPDDALNDKRTCIWLGSWSGLG